LYTILTAIGIFVPASNSCIVPVNMVNMVFEANKIHKAESCIIVALFSQNLSISTIMFVKSALKEDGHRSLHET
jgi:hypothetical protein